MGLAAALVDRARPVRRHTTDRKVEGRPVVVAQPGPWFRCRVSRNQGKVESHDEGRYKYTDNLVLLAGKRDLAGGLVGFAGDDFLEVESLDLGDDTFQVVGDPTPIRRRRGILGWEAKLRRVEEDRS